MKKIKNLRNEAATETSIPVAFLDGEPVMAFETRHECDKANLAAAGAYIKEIVFRWDEEVRCQRIDERLGLLNSNEQLKTITKYMLAVHPGVMAQAVTVEQAVLLVLERRWSRRIARLFGRVGAALPRRRQREEDHD
jgi:hypothetical protein